MGQEVPDLVRENQLNIYMYKRYVDDSAEGMEALKPVLRWNEEEGRMIIRAVESKILKVGKSLKIGKNRIKSEKSEKSEFIFY